MKKLTYKAGGLTITDYKAQRPMNTQPHIEESYINDDGNVVHILSNGRETLADIYNAVWNIPVNRQIMPKGYKGKNIDTRPIT